MHSYPFYSALRTSGRMQQTVGISDKRAAHPLTALKLEEGTVTSIALEPRLAGV